jgi:RNA polymerase sigma-70 factor, ECF subfamily
VVLVPAEHAELLRELHGRHGSGLCAFAYRLTGDRGRAEDVVQETLLRAWLSPAVLAAPDPARRAWLYTVARHLVADEWRSKRAHAEVATAEPPETSTADPSDDVLQGWLVAEAMSRLTREHRQVLFECFFRSRSVAEAARCLGVPEGTVKSRTHYALRALRVVLQEMGETR